jgi:hypothetical protein
VCREHRGADLSWRAGKCASWRSAGFLRSAGAACGLLNAVDQARVFDLEPQENALTLVGEVGNRG